MLTCTTSINTCTHTEQITFVPDYTTPTGRVASLATAGSILSQYLQAFGKNPSQFKQTDTYVVVPSQAYLADPTALPLPPGQHPNNSAWHVTTTFPDEVPLREISSAIYGVAEASCSATTANTKTTTIAAYTIGAAGAAATSLLRPTLGFATKLMAKRAAHLAAIRDLHARGELDDDLSPRPGGRAPPPKKARTKIKEGRDPATLSRWVTDGDGCLGPDTEDVQRGLGYRDRWEVWKAAMRDRIAPPSEAVGDVPRGVGEYVYAVRPEVMRCVYEWKGKSKERGKGEERAGDAEGEGEGEVKVRKLQATMMRWEQDAVPARRLMLLTVEPMCAGDKPFDLAIGTKDDVVRLTPLGAVKLKPEQAELARRYTERAVQTQLNKDVRLPPHAATWFVLPVKASFDPSVELKARRGIDYDEVEVCLGPMTAPFPLGTTAHEVEGIMTSSSSIYAQRCFLKLRSDLSPLSPHPAPKKGQEAMSIIDVARQNAGYKASGEAVDPQAAPPPLTLQDPMQPILEATPAHSGRSGGVIYPESKTPLYLIPELSLRYAYPAASFRTLSLLPWIHIALRDRLLVAEVNDKVFPGDLALAPALLQQALTTRVATSSPDRHYERLELLGDTIIKLLATLDSALGGDLTDEGHVEKHVLLSNRSLRDDGIRAGVVRYIRSKRDMPRGWVPEGWTLGEDVLGGEQTAKVGDKVVADVVEALVGAAYLSHGRSLPMAIKAMHRLCIPIDRLQSWDDLLRGPIEGPAGRPKTLIGTPTDGVAPAPKQAPSAAISAHARAKSLEVEVDVLELEAGASGGAADVDFKTKRGSMSKDAFFQSLLAGSLAPTPKESSASKGPGKAPPAPVRGSAPKSVSSAKAEVSRVDADVEKTLGKGKRRMILGYEFRDPVRAEVAFGTSHDVRNSQMWLKYKNVGDALLDYFVIEHLWDMYPECGPAPITHMKHSRVGDAALSALAVHTGLSDMVLQASATQGIKQNAERYVERITEAKRLADMAAEETPGAARVADGEEEQRGEWIEYWSSIYREHSLGDVPEVLIGAIFADSGFDTAPARRVYERHFEPFMDRYGVGPVSHSLHPKSRLSEHLANSGCGALELDAPVPDVPQPEGATARVLIHGQVVGEAQGPSPNMALRQACALALKMADVQWLKRVCDCPGKRI